MNRNKMKYKGFEANIMEAERLTGTYMHGLPPGRALDVYYVDEFLNPPENWMKGQGVFVVPVRPEKGLWFNWRDNDELNTAVIPTVKGCNPITGLKTSGFHMEQYESKCPKHGCKFLANRFCPECNYSWPGRNFCSMEPLWWDGFRADDGTIRQFFFTADSMRDVATVLIGKESTIPAFGFAFYTPKERRKVEVVDNYRGISHIYLSNTSMVGDTTKSFVAPDSFSLNETPSGATGQSGGSMKSFNPHLGESMKSFSLSQTESVPSGGIISSGGNTKGIHTEGLLKKSRIVGDSDENSRGIKIKEDSVQEVSIGAGARIRQSLNNDAYPLESWNDIPDAVMTIYFVFKEKFEELKAGGMRDLTGQAEGMLSDIPVG